MRYKAFLPLVTYPDPVSEATAANAVGMAARLGSDLHALAVNVTFPPVSNALSRFLLDTPQMIRDGEARSRKAGENLLAAVSEEAGRHKVTFTSAAITAAPALLAEAAMLESRYFDFVLLGWEPDNETCRMTAEALVFGAGRPTVLLPASARVRAIEHIAIAWDGSRVAARALADAGGLLPKAAQISVLTVVDDKPLPEGAPGEHLAESLRSRGLSAQA
ncbi:MAG: universal stress protein, partial [Rhizobiaceae bacterium]|nr:universal stress protein [Rhizobiaceae bacterium]